MASIPPVKTNTNNLLIFNTSSSFSLQENRLIIMEIVRSKIGVISSVQRLQWRFLSVSVCIHVSWLTCAWLNNLLHRISNEFYALTLKPLSHINVMLLRSRQLHQSCLPLIYNIFVFLLIAAIRLLGAHCDHDTAMHSPLILIVLCLHFNNIINFWNPSIWVHITSCFQVMIVHCF